MKEKGMFFTEEQKELLREIDRLEAERDKYLDDRKSLSVERRMQKAEEITSRYSMLKSKKGIMQEQLFSAMEEYLKYCVETGYKLTGL